MKKLLSLMLTIALVLSSTCAFAQTFTAGTYEGVATGFGGEVKATVALSDSAITDVQLVGDGETAGIGSVALEQLPQAIIDAQSTQIDTIATATITSDAVLEAVNAALTAAGIDPATLTPVAQEEASVDQAYEADIVIVGAGGAGMTAAITAAQAGKKVVILESQAMAGGNSVRATGGMNAAKTALQDANTFAEAAGIENMLINAANYADNEAITALAATVKTQWDAYQASPEGYFDSIELFELDTMVGGKGINNPALVATLAENSAAGIAWLESIGANLTSVGSFGGASVKRIHRPVNAEGKTISVGSYIVPILQDKCEELGVTIVYGTRVNEVLANENGAAVGVKGENTDGATVTATAKAVVLASGGFGANLDMVTEYVPSLAGFATTNAAGIQGDGIAMATAIGAATVDMDQIQIHPTVEINTAALITEGLRGDGAILLNAEGNRFCDEVGTRDVVSAAEIAQTGSFAWLVIDQKMVDASSVIGGYITKGFTVEGDSYEALAAAMDVPADALSATMDTWNANVAATTDAEFGRTSFANALDTAPFYAIKVSPGVHHTMGGLLINTDTQVLTADGSAIPGLYAAGEITGGVHGANRLGGNAVSDFVVYGRIAGQNASEFAK